MGRRLYVGNLPYSATEEQLTELFSQAGKVDNVRVMVTPVEYRGYSMFTNKEGMTVAATSFALQWALMKAIDKFKEARNEGAKEAARKEVIEAMNELEKARLKAGLPPK